MILDSHILLEIGVLQFLLIKVQVHVDFFELNILCVLRSAHLLQYNEVTLEYFDHMVALSNQGTLVLKPLNQRVDQFLNSKSS